MSRHRDTEGTAVKVWGRGAEPRISRRCSRLSTRPERTGSHADRERARNLRFSVDKEIPSAFAVRRRSP